MTPALPLPGDLVAFTDHFDRIVVHRFLGHLPSLRFGFWLITAADRASRMDDPVSRQHLIGVVREVNGSPYRPGLRRRVVASVRFVRELAARAWHRFGSA